MARAKWFFHKKAGRLGRFAEEAYSQVRKRFSGFNLYERENQFFRAPVLRELNRVMGFREDYEHLLYTRDFENRFSSYMGTRYSVGASSGTSALALSMRALGIRSGDEVITVPNTYIATALAIRNAGARPVFVDVERGTFNMDPGRLDDAITDKTKAILPVHMYGNPCDLHSILRIARRNGLRVIEDACQAHGADLGGKKTGSIGDAGCFSFFRSKNLGGLGNGGMSITNNRRTAERIRAMSSPESKRFSGKGGRPPSYLGAVQAAFLKPKLGALDEMNDRRRLNARLYREGLVKSGLGFQEETPGGRHVYFSFVVRSGERERLRKHLSRRGVETRMEYPTPLHTEPAFRDLGYREGDFPVSERLCREVLSLPVSPFLEEGEVEEIARKALSFRGHV